jgi:hypothetical protein
VELARLFGFLAGLEDKHAQQVNARSRPFGSAGPDLAIVRWEIPENFDEEAARSAALTPYGALAVAVRNEERAFAFYCHAAAAASPDIAAMAEDLARDELQHAAMLRRARRDAWRREGRRPAATGLPDSVAALHNLIEVWRGEAAQLHHALAHRLDAEGEADLAAVFRQVADSESPDSIPGEFAACLPEVRDGLRVLEDAFERLSDIAVQCADPAIGEAAQVGAEETVLWLAIAGGAWRNTLLQRVGQWEYSGSEQ